MASLGTKCLKDSKDGVYLEHGLDDVDRERRPETSATRSMRYAGIGILIASICLTIAILHPGLDFGSGLGKYHDVAEWMGAKGRYDAAAYPRPASHLEGDNGVIVADRSSAGGSDESMGGASRSPADDPPQVLARKQQRYRAAVTKGKAMQALIDAKPGPQDTGKPFTQQDLAKTGWENSAEDDGFEQDLKGMSPDSWGIFQSALNDMGLLNVPGMKWSWWQHTVPKGTGANAQYNPTGGRYIQKMNVGRHMILAYDAYGPKTQASEQEHVVTGAADDPFPPLEHWSDVVFLEWKAQCGNNANMCQGLQQVLKSNIANPISNDVIDYILSKHKDLPDVSSLEYKESLIIPPGTDDFYALLGVPNGYPVSHLLADHKKSLGWKMITKIRLFGQTPADPYLLFLIKPHDGQGNAGSSSGKSSPSTSSDESGQPGQFEWYPQYGGSRPQSGKFVGGISPGSSDQDATPARRRAVLATDSTSSQSDSGNNTASHTKHKRLTYYEKALSKGKEMQKLIDVPPTNADTGRVFTDGDFAEYGWSDAEYGWSDSAQSSMSPPKSNDRESRRLTQLLKQMSLNPNLGKWVHWLHFPSDQPKPSRNGHTYYKTGAFYSQLFSIDTSTIFAFANFGPQSRVSQVPQPKADGSTNKPFPPLSSWSDVTFLDWKRLSANNPAKMRALSMVVQCNLGSLESEPAAEVIDDVCRKQGTDIEDHTYECPLTITPDQEDFYALLGTVNGYGVAHLLADHKVSLGWKMVTKIDLFVVGADHAQTGYLSNYFMTLHIGAHNKAPPAQVIPAKRPHEGTHGYDKPMRRNGAVGLEERTSAPGVNDLAKRSALTSPKERTTTQQSDIEALGSHDEYKLHNRQVDAQPRSSTHPNASSSNENGSGQWHSGKRVKMAQSSWDDAVTRGRKLLASMEASLSTSRSQQSTWTKYDDLTRYGWTFSQTPINNVDSQSYTDGYVDAMTGFSIPNTRGNNIHVNMRHNRQSAPNGAQGPVYLPTGASYLQLFNVEGGTIFAMVLESPRLNGPKQNQPVEGGSLSPFVPLERWSDLTFLQWQELTGAKPGLLSGLRRIIHCAIKDNLTGQVIDEILRRRDNLVKPPGFADRIKITRADEDEFMALLGSPNGRGAAHMLAQHKATLGWKVVDSFELYSAKDDYNSDEIFLVINIGCFHQSGGSTGSFRGSENGQRASRLDGYDRGLSTQSSSDGEPSFEGSDSQWNKATTLGQNLLADTNLPPGSAPAPRSKHGDVSGQAAWGQAGFAAQEGHKAEIRSIGSSTDETGGHGGHSLVSRQIPSNNLLLGRRSCVDLGVNLAQQLENPAAPPTPAQYTTVQDLHAMGYVRQMFETVEPSRLPIFQAALSRILPGMPQPRLQLSRWASGPWTRNGERLYGFRETFNNLHHATVILGTFHTKSHSGARPPLQGWAAVTYLSHLDALPASNLRLLRHVIRSGHPTDDTSFTQRTLENIGSLGSGRDFATRQIYRPPREEYHLLLGVVPGREVAELLLTHRQSLGAKRVSQISIWHDNNFPVIWYELEDIQGPPPASGPGIQSGVTAPQQLGGVGQQNGSTGNPYGQPQSGPSNTGNGYNPDGNPQAGPSRRPQRRSTDIETGDDAWGLAEHGIDRRMAPPRDITEAQIKGQEYAKMMNAQLNGVQQSKFTQTSDLAKFGWDTPDTPGGPKLSTLRDVEKNAKDIVWYVRKQTDASYVKEDTLQVYRSRMVHCNDYACDPTDGPANSNPHTEAEYAQFYDLRVIIMNWAQSPAKNEKGVTALPSLQHWSDVTFLQYQAIFPQDLKKLSAVASLRITEPDTNRILDEIFKNLGRATYFPGMHFDYTTRTRQFEALLATPNGYGTAYLLGQHKAQLGIKCVDRIYVWFEPDGVSANLLYLIKDAPCGPPPLSAKFRELKMKAKL